jgi:formylglycine-generating enzyme required for sulfatase activity
VARIFLSYRRDDTGPYAGRLYDRLQQHFGRDDLFMDIDTITLGLDFVEAIQDAVGSCQVLLAVIGRQWLTSTDPEGNRRLDNPEDFVRLEITTALRRDIRVIPVLVGGASMPRATELPEELRPLARRQALAVGDRFHPDVDRLMQALETVLGVVASSSARTPTPSTVFPASWTNSIGMEFLLIPAGHFFMGTTDAQWQESVASGAREGYRDEMPQHHVVISQPFYLGKTPVTQGQWHTIMGENPSRFTGDPLRPVERVSWHDVQQFLQRLNAREGVMHYRLPTEAQWEYACRAGTAHPQYHEDIDAIAWYAGNSGDHTHPVGQKHPNAWGLYDMLGNVWEWCHDGKRAYTAGTVQDPMGPEAGADRALRGGGWGSPAQLVRAAHRGAYQPGLADAVIGFRAASSGPSR